MEPQTQFGRLLALTAVALLAVVFAFPFLWMVVTSLMPLEQAMSSPPRWVPRGYAVEMDGEYVDVIKGQAIGTDGYIVQPVGGLSGGQKLFVAAPDYVDGRVRVVRGGQERWVPAELIRQVRADFVRVTERRAIQEDVAGRWDLVPPETIRESASPQWSNYKQALERIPFLTYLKNTLIVCVLGVLGTLFSCSLAAYSLARIPWRGRGVLFAITLGTMMVPFPVLMVPLFGLFKSLGWVGTLKPLWVPAFFGTGYNIFLLRQFFLTIPKDLSEAARIDGCSEWAIFWRIILPLSKPALVVVALFHFLYAWNDFIGPLLYLTRQDTYTLSLGLQMFENQQGAGDWNVLMAAGVLMILPVVLLFLLAQKSFVKGIATTGIKG